MIEYSKPRIRGDGPAHCEQNDRCLTESAARQYVGAFFKALSDAIIQGQRIEIRGFGVWEVRRASEPTQARNPMTGEQVFVPARQRVRFKAGKTVQTGLQKEEKRVRILVIDDDETVRTVLCKMLQLAGYAVEEALDGAEGVRRYYQNPAQVVIVDIFMLGKNGLEVIEEIKRDFPDVKIIAISGIDIKDRVEMAALASLCGAFRLLEKPFSQAELLTAVRDVLA